MCNIEILHIDWGGISAIVTKLYPLSRAWVGPNIQQRAWWADRRASGKDNSPFIRFGKDEQTRPELFWPASFRNLKAPANVLLPVRARPPTHSKLRYANLSSFRLKRSQSAFDKVSESEKVRMIWMALSVQIRTSFAKRSGPVWVRLYF